MVSKIARFFRIDVKIKVLGLLNHSEKVCFIPALGIMTIYMYAINIGISHKGLPEYQKNFVYDHSTRIYTFQNG